MWRPSGSSAACRRAGLRFLFASASVGGGLVLLRHARWDTPALIDRDAVALRPGPDISAALTAGGGTARPARLCPPGLAGVLDERPQLLTGSAGGVVAQIDLIIRAAEPEPHGLVGWTAIQVRFQRDSYLFGRADDGPRRQAAIAESCTCRTR